MSGPLTLVLAEVAAGTSTLAEMARNSGLAESVVRAAVDHLVRSGRLEARELAIGCPPAGCGGCALAAADKTPGCAPGAGAAPSRAGVVTLSLARRPA